MHKIANAIEDTIRMKSNFILAIIFVTGFLLPMILFVLGGMLSHAFVDLLIILLGATYLMLKIKLRRPMRDYIVLGRKIDRWFSKTWDAIPTNFYRVKKHDWFNGILEIDSDIEVKDSEVVPVWSVGITKIGNLSESTVIINFKDHWYIGYVVR